MSLGSAFGHTAIVASFRLRNGRELSWNALFQPVLAGLVTAVVGFAGAFTVVLTGLRAVGADEHQAASGLLVVSLASGAVAVVLGVAVSDAREHCLVDARSGPARHRGRGAGGIPGRGRRVPAVWGARRGRWAGRAPLGRLVAAIPGHIAGAMLAGVLLPLCLAPV